MTQPTPTEPHIPGLVTTNGVTPQTLATPQTGASITANTGEAGAANTPVVVPPPVAPVPAPVPQPPPTPPQPTTTPPPGDTDRGYPQDTPLEQMTAEQREAYWRHHSRKWEKIAKDRNDYDTLRAAAEELNTLKAANATDQEKAVAAARAAGYAEASGRAAVILVDAHVRAGLSSRMTPDRIEAFVGHLDHKHFLGADGVSVDAEKVAAFVNAVAPPPSGAVTAPPGMTVVGGVAYPVAAQAPAATAPYAAPLQPGTGLPRALPDLGQGSTTAAKPSGLAAGKAIAAQRFGDQNTQRP
jgi:hypothetical protein